MARDCKAAQQAGAESTRLLQVGPWLPQPASSRAAAGDHKQHTASRCSTCGQAAPAPSCAVLQHGWEARAVWQCVLTGQCALIGQCVLRNVLLWWHQLMPALSCTSAASSKQLSTQPSAVSTVPTCLVTTRGVPDRRAPCPANASFSTLFQGEKQERQAAEERLRQAGRQLEELQGELASLSSRVEERTQLALRGQQVGPICSPWP